MRRYNEQKSPLYRHFLKLPYTHLTEADAQKMHNSDCRPTKSFYTTQVCKIEHAFLSKDKKHTYIVYKILDFIGQQSLYHICTPISRVFIKNNTAQITVRYYFRSIQSRPAFYLPYSYCTGIPSYSV